MAWNLIKSPGTKFMYHGDPIRPIHSDSEYNVGSPFVVLGSRLLGSGTKENPV